MVEVLGAEGAVVDHVARPQTAELGALHGQLADQLGQLLVVGALPGGHPQRGDRAPGLLLALGVELAGVRIEEEQPLGVGPVRRTGRAVEVQMAGDQGVPEAVPRQHLEARPEGEGRHALHGGEQLPHAGAGGVGADRRAAPVRRRAGELPQMGALVGGQPQGPGEGVQHALRGVVALALFEAGVVGDADAGELGELLAPQSGDPAARPVGDQADVLRLQPGAAGAQEVPQRGGAGGGGCVHARQCASRGGRAACPCQGQAAGRGPPRARRITRDGAGRNCSLDVTDCLVCPWRGPDPAPVSAVRLQVCGGIT
ncbi:hypothetical protein GZL_01883 [Streptomyces sp. 769]|nr:hypothetical protein GZL_01883 [Streptomyces sp. 769]